MKLLQKIIAVIRTILIVIVLLDGAILFALFSILPFKYRGDPLQMWVTTWMARAFMWLFQVDLRVEGKELLRQHDGFVFPNHGSYLDVLTLQSVRPMRYVAYAGVQGLPVVGWMAKKMGTVFVERGNKNSREAARAMIANLPQGSPVVLFPEGKITETAELDMFRYGAFHLAIAKGFDIIPVAIHFADYELACQGDDPIIKAVWDLAHHPKMRVDIHALSPIRVAEWEDGEALTDETKATIAKALEEMRNAG